MTWGKNTLVFKIAAHNHLYNAYKRQWCFMTPILSKKQTPTTCVVEPQCNSGVYILFEVASGGTATFRSAPLRHAGHQLHWQLGSHVAPPRESFLQQPRRTAPSTATNKGQTLPRGLQQVCFMWGRLSTREGTVRIEADTGLVGLRVRAEKINHCPLWLIVLRYLGGKKALCFNLSRVLIIGLCFLSDGARQSS